MNIKDKIQQDLDKLHVSKEIELLRKALNIYMVRLNNYLVSKGSMSFDYYGGCFNNNGYFDFTKNVLFIIDCKNTLATVEVFEGQSLGVWELMVRKDWYKDGCVLTRNFYDDGFLHIKPSWVKSFIEDITPPQQLELF